MMAGKRRDGYYLLPNGRYKTRYRDADGIQHWATFDTKTQARQWRESNLVAIGEGSWVDPSAGLITLAQLYDELHVAREYAPATLASQVETWKRIGPTLGHRSIARISPTDVDRVLATIDAPSMREKVRLPISTLYNHAGHTNPAKRKLAPSTRASRKREGAKPKRYLKADELARLMTEIPERYRVLVHVMARVGLRPGEAYALRVGKFDPMKRTLLIDTAASGDTKTGESRTVNLPAAVAEELVAHIEDWTPDALIFPGPRGAMIQAGNFRNRVLSCLRPSRYPWPHAQRRET
jgi:integrase